MLEDAGISWKVYNPTPVDLLTPVLNDNYLEFFKQYTTNPTLALKAFASLDYPIDFQNDCASGKLPAVSWVLAPFVESEHPPTPLRWGEFAVGQALAALTANPDVWAKTAFLLTWDDSGGFFDHVTPPHPANPNEPGEHLTAVPPVGAYGGINGPIGLGFRVPMLVISPFSRNPIPKSDPGWRPMVSSQVFDHTSVLRFIQALFVAKGRKAADVALPYDTAWRAATVGDLTTAFHFAAPNKAVPVLTYPTVSDVTAQLAKAECLVAPNTFTPLPQPVAYTIPAPQAVPQQDPGTAISPSGLIPGQGACGVSISNPGNGGGGTPTTSSGAPVGAASLDVAAGAAILAGAWWYRRVRDNRAKAGATLEPGSDDPGP